METVKFEWQYVVNTRIMKTGCFVTKQIVERFAKHKWRTPQPSDRHWSGLIRLYPQFWRSDGFAGHSLGSSATRCPVLIIRSDIKNDW